MNKTEIHYSKMLWLTEVGAMDMYVFYIDGQQVGRNLTYREALENYPTEKYDWIELDE